MIESFCKTDNRIAKKAKDNKKFLPSLQGDEFFDS